MAPTLSLDVEMEMSKGITQKEINRIKELRAQGLTQTVIATRMGLSQKTISKYCAEANHDVAA